MKQALTIVLIFLLIASIPVFLLGLASFMVQDPVLSSLPDYQEKMYFSSGGFQDFTDYAKYTFDNMDASVLEANPYFIPVTSEDKKEILSYIENFENWVAIIGDDLAQKYDFDKSAIAEGDYFHCGR